MSDRIRGIHVNTSGGVLALIVGEESAYSGRKTPTTVLSIDKVMGAGGAEGARDVYRVFSTGDGVEERLEIPSACVPIVILEEEK